MQLYKVSQGLGDGPCIKLNEKSDGQSGTTIPQTVEKWTCEGEVNEIQFSNVAQLVHVDG